MKNANKPAMPIELSGLDKLTPTIYTGLTKLEYFALKIHCATISHHGKACLDESINEAGRFLKEFEK